MFKNDQYYAFIKGDYPLQYLKFVTN